jgi:hypothetical protein
MSKAPVQMHGGRLWVVRTVKGGSEYHYTLPVTWRDRVTAASLSPGPSALAS